MATYGCDEGYNITSGDFVTWCEEPGVWNGTEPFCEVVGTLLRLFANLLHGLFPEV